LLCSYFTAQVSQYDLYGLSFCCKYRVAVGETNPDGGSIQQREATLMFMTPACSDLQATNTSKDKLDCSQFSRCLWDLQCIMLYYEVWNDLKYCWENTVKKKSPRKKQCNLYCGLLCYDITYHNTRYKYFRRMCHPHLQGCLKMEAVFCSKMLVCVYRTTCCHNPEGHNINLGYHENLKFNTQNVIIS